MEKYVGAALDYAPRWLAYQLRATEQPGCAVAIRAGGRLVFNEAFGSADLSTGRKLTPRHLFRVASHSKSFTAAGILKLKDQKRLRLDDPLSDYVSGLHPSIAQTTISDCLSHGAGILRDGPEAEFWNLRQRFPSAQKLRADLTAPVAIEPNTRFKYSNYGFGLLGLAIEAITGESYHDWIMREIVQAAGLSDTAPEISAALSRKMCGGHGSKTLLGSRAIYPGDQSTGALASATGFVSTAADLTAFFTQLDPAAKTSILSVAARRAMVRRLWRVPDTSIERDYGLGIIHGAVGGWRWFGHSGGFPGYITQTAVFPDHGLTISVLTNAIDGLAGAWLEGIVRILQTFRAGGPPTRKSAGWAGRWWSSWGAVDFVPVGDKVQIAAPGLLAPFLEASELTLEGRDGGTITRAGGFASFGERVQRKRDAGGAVVSIRAPGGMLVGEPAMKAEMRRRHRFA